MFVPAQCPLLALKPSVSSLNSFLSTALPELKRFFTGILGEDIFNAVESILLSNYKRKLM